MIWLVFVSAQVVLDMQTNWEAPSQCSLLQEVSEYYSNLGLFWEFLSRLSESSSIWEVGRSQSEKKLIEASLYNREFSPKLEFLAALERTDRAGLTQDCNEFYVVNGKSTCMVDKQLLGTPIQNYLESDHVFNPSENTLIAYLNISSPNFQETNLALKEFALENNCSYVLRHLNCRAEGKDTVSGFGGSLLIKDMEYKPLEDVNVQITSDSGNWNLENLPLKAVEATKSLLPDWKAMTDMMLNYPDYLETLSTTEVPPQVATDSMNNALSHFETIGSNRLVVNEHLVPIEFFSVLDLVRNQVGTLDRVTQLGIPSYKALRILQSINSAMHLHDTQPGVLSTQKNTGRVYLNDLEKDKRYSKWPNRIEYLVFSSSMQLEKIASNTFNLILVADITSQTGIEAIKNLVEVYKEDWPVHLGVILQGGQHLVNLVLQAIKNLYKLDETYPTQFLSQLSADISFEEALSLYNTFCKECTYDEEYLQPYERCKHFCEVTGLCGPSQWILNGKVLSIDGEFMTQLYTQLVMEKRYVQVLAMKGVLSAPFSSFFEKAQHEKVVTRINTNITSQESNQVTLVEPSEGVIFELNEAPKLATITVYKKHPGDHLVKMAFETLQRFSHLPIRLRFLIEEFDEPEVCLLFTALETGTIEEECKYETHILFEYYRTIQSKTPVENGVAVNSRFVGSESLLSFRDVHLLYETEVKRLNMSSVLSELETLETLETLEAPNTSDVLEKISFIGLSSIQHLSDFKSYDSKPIPESMWKESLSREIGEPETFVAKVLLNPMSEEGQKLASLVQWLLSVGAQVKVVFNPDIKLTEKVLPIHRYYQLWIRQSFEEPMQINGKANHVFTLSLDSPESWFTLQGENTYDLDNLILEGNTPVKYKLQNLMIKGQCAQEFKGFEIEPPNGLQLQLKQTSFFVSDTIVMKNFGYFQFKANPGLYSISLASGRSSELFHIESSSIVAVEDIKGPTVFLKAAKNEGFENEELLDSHSVEELGDTIHVFSLASGKLYERLLRIMVTSVVANTKNPVKFWLLEDFFTQEFKDSLFYLSRALDFQYEFVSYKWPSWLYRQKEKQRIIWAYKILFLDVLFPLEVPKVIYIDADQVVRSDIKELWEMDLQGAPYAYTPFCDSNPDTEGFRFWKHGYWKNHLGQKPYHISALYVVDLVRFRSMGAGDTLRVLYENMAPNPDSLANLDQDLPNFAQVQIPIFSLPQEWLWCATWCSEESKKYAKTIDLCNNPLTKEPKIEAAKRIIPEWTNYDTQLKEFEKNPQGFKFNFKKYREDL